MKKIFECRDCASKEIIRDAYAIWNIETQEWKLLTVYDYAACIVCGSMDIGERHE